MYFITFFQTHPAIFVFCAALLGLAVGSFLNVVIYRLPVMMERDWRQQCRQLLSQDPETENEDNGSFNLFMPRSRCPDCQHTISAMDNIPVLSYWLLRGRCRYCSHPISLRYPAIELLSGMVTALLAWRFGFHLQFLFAAILSWSLVCLTFIDLEHQFLPDDITLPVLWLGLLVNMFGVFTDIYSSLLGAILGYGVLWIIFIAFKLLTGKEGMGYGDFKLLAMLGAWLGWQQLPFIILASSLIGVITGFSLILISGRDRSTPFPFGPSLAAAGWIALLWGNDITRLYLGMYQ